MQQHKDTPNIEAYYNVLTHTTSLITDTIIITHVYSITGPTHTHTQLQYTTKVMYAIETVITEPIQQINH